MDVINQRKVTQSCDRGYNWLRIQLNNNGKFKNSNELGAYYKAPLAFKIMEGKEYRKIGEYIVATFGNNGWIVETNKSEQYLTFCPIYRLSWLLLGMKNIDTLNQTIADNYFRLSNYENEFWNANGESDILSVSLIGIVALQMNKPLVALAAGKWLLTAIAKQKVSGTICIRFSDDWEIITPKSKTDTSWCKISSEQNHPKTYIAGILVYFLTELFRHTNDNQWLEAAKNIFTYIQGWKSLSFAHPYSGKILLATSNLYSITNDMKYYTHIPGMIDYLISLQCENSFWFLRDTYNSPIEQPLEISLDRTSEYIIFLKLASKILAER